MKRNPFFKVLGLAICFYAVVSCQKDEISSSNQALSEQAKALTPEQKQQFADLSNPEQNEDVVARKGRLVFKDLDVFKKVIGELKAMKSESDVKNWAKNLNYTPIAKVYKEKWKEKGLITKEFCEENQMPFVPDPTFAMILNKDGVYQIGKEIQKITIDKGYSVIESKEELLNDLKNTSLKKYEIVSETKKGTTKLRPNNINGGYFVPEENGYYIYVYVEYWSVSYAYYASIGIRSGSTNTFQTIKAHTACNYKFIVLGAIIEHGEVYGESTGYDTDYTSSTIIWRLAPWWANGHFEYYGFLHGYVDYNGQRYYGSFL